MYAIPALLLIGWRGLKINFKKFILYNLVNQEKKIMNGQKLKEKNTEGLLTEIGVKFQVLPDYIEGAAEVLDNALTYML